MSKTKYCFEISVVLKYQTKYHNYGSWKNTPAGRCFLNREYRVLFTHLFGTYTCSSPCSCAHLAKIPFMTSYLNEHTFQRTITRQAFSKHVFLSVLTWNVHQLLFTLWRPGTLYCRLGVFCKTTARHVYRPSLFHMLAIIGWRCSGKLVCHHVRQLFAPRVFPRREIVCCIEQFWFHVLHDVTDRCYVHIWWVSQSVWVSQSL